MAALSFTNHELLFIWDSINDRRINCLDLLDSEIHLDADTVQDLDETAMECDRLQDIIFSAMED